MRLKKNSGNPAKPTNIGIDISRGEYVFILDNDDMITKTALEELYPTAKKFNADVVHCERYYQFNDGEKILKLTSYQTGEFVKTPTLITENLTERVIDFHNKRFIWNLWTKLIRRDFLLEYGIKLIDLLPQDLLFTRYLILTAKRYLRVPNAVNIYRMRKDSLSHVGIDFQKNIHITVYAAVKGFKCYSEFMDVHEIFKNQPDLKFFCLILGLCIVWAELQIIIIKYRLTF